MIVKRAGFRPYEISRFPDLPRREKTSLIDRRTLQMRWMFVGRHLMIDAIVVDERTRSPTRICSIMGLTPEAVMIIECPPEGASAAPLGDEEESPEQDIKKLRRARTVRRYRMSCRITPHGLKSRTDR